MVVCITSNLKRNNVTGAVLLNGNDGVPRVLGIWKDNIFSTRRTWKQILRVNQSIGFNHELLSSCTFDVVEVLLDGKLLTTTREHALSKGDLMKFAKSGNELQVFLPIAEFSKN